MTREEAIKGLKAIRKFYRHKPYEEMFDMAIKALEAQEWIPCSEGLPLVGDTYIVTVEDKDGRHVDAADSHGDYIDGYWNTFNDWYEGQEVHVIAWMEKPKPYKAESEE